MSPKMKATSSGEAETSTGEFTAVVLVSVAEVSREVAGATASRVSVGDSRGRIDGAGAMLAGTETAQRGPRLLSADASIAPAIAQLHTKWRVAAEARRIIDVSTHAAHSTTLARMQDSMMTTIMSANMFRLLLYGRV
jgi:hypothetical protein